MSETWGDFGGGGGGSGAAPSRGPAGRADTGAARGDGGKNTIENLRGGRTERLDEWIESIKDTRRPTLNFKHLLLPHVPWQYLPDGRATASGTDPIPQISRQSYTDQGQIDVLQQRHLLQVGFVDRELQRLIAQLKKEGLWDKSMVVLTADHGVARSARAQFDRRKATETNVDEISPVPLFIKAPGQEKGRVNREIVETTDMLPDDARHPQHRAAGEDRRQVRVLAGRSQRGPSSRCSSATCPAGSGCPSPSSSSARCRRCASGSPSSATATTARSGSTGSAPTSS